MSSTKEGWSPFARSYDPIVVGSIDGTDTAPHDRALLRAMWSDYRPDRQVQGAPHNTLFIGRLNLRTTQDTVMNEFSKFGKVVRCRLVKDVVTGKSRGYAFVEYERRAEARGAESMHGEDVDGSRILVQGVARVLSGWRPRRLGGGFGGRREAGQLRFGGRDRPFQKPLLTEHTARSQTRDTI